MIESRRGGKFDSVRTGHQGEMGGRMEKESLLSNQCWLLAFPKALNCACAQLICTLAHIVFQNFNAFPPGAFF